MLLLLGCIYPHGEDYYLFDDEPPEVEDEGMWWLKAKAMEFEEFFDKIHLDIWSLFLVPVPAADDRGLNIKGSGDREYKVSTPFTCTHLCRHGNMVRICVSC